MTGRVTPKRVPPSTYFRNAMSILGNIDRKELERAGILPVGDHNAWGTYRRNPFRFFLMADDLTMAKLWKLIDRRLVSIPLSTTVSDVITAAMHALRSYEYGNGSTDLAKSVADACEAVLININTPTDKDQRKASDA